MQICIYFANIFFSNRKKIKEEKELKGFVKKEPGLGSQDNVGSSSNIIPTSGGDNLKEDPLSKESRIPIDDSHNPSSVTKDVSSDAQTSNDAHISDSVPEDALSNVDVDGSTNCNANILKVSVYSFFI